MPVGLFRFVVRDFRYSEEELTAGKNEITKLETDKKKQFVSRTVVGCDHGILKIIYHACAQVQQSNKYSLV